ncbi:hypothetical protein BUALT_Bualt06G0082600 [Buddleja alternifolia]|uniref:Histone-lysine N-methyltransferase n=1 Tax=Buddleja alternifolia TaxID=168488 RepID=A0AAV6XDM8_9LAMI|nr:hypothetical protein BUALT_Bualt06G0082600 [Buddleja alternifolia]
MPAKQLLETGGVNSHNFPSSFKHPSSNAFQKYPVTCSAIASDNYSSDIKRHKVDHTRDFSGHTRYTDAKKYVAAIPAVPLRSLPSINVKKDCGAENGKDVDASQKMANDNENTVGSSDEAWKRDSEKVAAVIAQAKEYINMFDTKYSMFKKTLQNLDGNLSEKEMKVEDSVSKMVQEEKTSGMGSMSEDDEEGICILSPAEWSNLQLCSKRKSDTKIGKEVTEPEKSSDHKFNEEHNMVQSQVNEIVDLVDLDVDECASTGEKEKLTIDDYNAIVKYSGTAIETVVNSHDETKYEDLINLRIVRHDEPQGSKARKALKMFEELYEELLVELKSEELRGEGKGTRYAHLEVAERLKLDGMWVFAEKPFGHIPGVEVGDEFQFRAELAVVGLHRQLISGIDYVILNGKKFATSVVNSGRYENDVKDHDILIYSGQGGNPKIRDKACDQKLEKGNLALMNSMEMGYPVRVTHKQKNPLAANTRNFLYVYDGLYTVNVCWQERDQNGKLVFKFELQKMSGQTKPRQSIGKSRKAITRMEVCVVNDISQGKENLPIRAMNGVDDDKPPPFTYMTNIVYPYWYKPVEPIGCNCINGCLDSLPCSCVLKNGGEIPFNEKGAIIRAKRRVHECGSSCKCPPSCMNRVSQNGPRHQLEIFKTESRGWGVRSRNYISSGSFICEYVGELLHDKEAELRVGDDEYLFDIYDDSFAIDAAVYGNIGRFINHSCSPNLYGQEVLYDHDDMRMPHIMFFATKNIPPLQELTYDYNYKMNRICDVNGNIKTKACYCGSRKCTGRMY